MFTLSKTEKTKIVWLVEKSSSVLVNLWERWQEEKEYENIADYAIPLKSYIEEVGFEFIAMSKKPFGFTFRSNENNKFRIECKKQGRNSCKVQTVYLPEGK